MNTEMPGVWTVCSNAAIKRAARRLGQLYEGVLQPTGLRATQFTLMAQIARSDRPSLRQLADALVMDLSALGHTLKPLMRDGLVRLVPDDGDRRVKRAELTDSGTVRLAEAQRYWAEAQSRFDGAFGADKAKALRDILADVSTNEFAARFDKPTEPASPSKESR